VSGVTIGDYCDFTPLEVRGASLASSNGRGLTYFSKVDNGALLP